MTTLTTTNLIAIYAAIVATVGIVWQLYQYWIRGPRLTGDSGINMVIINDPAREPEQKFATLNVQNRGTEATFITNIGLLGYETIIDYWLNRPTFSAVVVHAISAYPLPGKLSVGGEWRSMCIQDEKLEQLTRSKIMCFALSHSFSSKPFRVRIAPVPLKD